jgi:hypothetical protein
VRRWHPSRSARGTPANRLPQRRGARRSTPSRRSRRGSLIDRLDRSATWLDSGRERRSLMIPNHLDEECVAGEALLQFSSFFSQDQKPRKPRRHKGLQGRPERRQALSANENGIPLARPAPFCGQFCGQSSSRLSSCPSRLRGSLLLFWIWLTGYPFSNTGWTRRAFSCSQCPASCTCGSAAGTMGQTGPHPSTNNRPVSACGLCRQRVA